MMEFLSERSSPLWQRWQTYHLELEAIQRKLDRNLPLGKRERLTFRSRDLQTRLIPQLVEKLQLF